MAYYARNKDKFRADKAKRKERNRALIRAAKSVPCKDCGDSHPHYVMDFDHLDASVKRFNVANMLDCGTEMLKSEIEKCDVVCANCHRERTHQRANHAPLV